MRDKPQRCVTHLLRFRLFAKRQEEELSFRQPPGHILEGSLHSLIIFPGIPTNTLSREEQNEFILWQIGAILASLLSPGRKTDRAIPCGMTRAEAADGASIESFTLSMSHREGVAICNRLWE